VKTQGRILPDQIWFELWRTDTFFDHFFPTGNLELGYATRVRERL